MLDVTAATIFRPYRVATRVKAVCMVSGALLAVWRRMILLRFALLGAVAVRPGRMGVGIVIHGMQDRMLTSTEAMNLLGYRCRKAFWHLVYSGGIPHVRYNARVIRFPSAGLDDWLQRHGSS